jgi:hypothetical protein
MRRPAPFLYLGLGVGGLLLGIVLGEVLLTRGSGLYVGPAMAIIGLVLAWMLRATRRPPDADVPPPAPPMPPPTPRVVRPGHTVAGPKVDVRTGSPRGRRAGQGKKGKGR